MADLDVVPKRRTHVWLWIVLPIIVAIVLWMMLGRGSSSASRSGRAVDRDAVGSFADAHVPTTLVDL